MIFQPKPLESDQDVIVRATPTQQPKNFVSFIIKLVRTLASRPLKGACPSVLLEKSFDFPYLVITTGKEVARARAVINPFPVVFTPSVHIGDGFVFAVAMGFCSTAENGDNVRITGHCELSFH
ncbi:MAG: hypothetical protein ACKO5E_13070, partial [bacterium]